MLQWLLVFPMVLASALYAIWALLSPARRLSLLDATAGSLGAHTLLKTPHASLRRRAIAQLAGGCGSCAANTVVNTAKRRPE